MAQEKKRHACLVRISAAGTSRTQLIDKDEFSIGRSAEADVLSFSLGVSRVHAVAKMQEGSVWICDMGSANGTFVDGKRIEVKKTERLGPAAQVTFGDSNESYLFELVELPLELGDLQSAREAAKAAALASCEEARAAVVEQAKSAAEREAREWRAKAASQQQASVAKAVTEAIAAAKSEWKKSMQAEANAILDLARAKATETLAEANAAMAKARAEMAAHEARAATASFATPPPHPPFDDSSDNLHLKRRKSS